MPASDFIVNRGSGPNLQPRILSQAGAFGSGTYSMNLAQMAEQPAAWIFENGPVPSMPNPATYYLLSAWYTPGNGLTANEIGIQDNHYTGDPNTGYLTFDIGAGSTEEMDGFTGSVVMTSQSIPPPFREFSWLSKKFTAAPNALIHCLLSVDANGTAELSFNGIPVPVDVVNAFNVPTGKSWNIAQWTFLAGQIGVILGDFWFTATNSYASAHDPAVAGKFIDGNGQPVYLGANGELPLGYQPALFFSAGGTVSSGGTLRTLPTQLPIALRCVPCAPVMVCGPGQPRK